MTQLTTDDRTAGSLEDALRAALGTQERAARASAIDDASRRADPEALVVLMGDHADSISRNAAMDALTRGGARSLSALVRALRHDDPEVVMFAAGVLGKTRDRAAIPHLVGLLTHLDVNVVQQAIESLALLRAGAAVSALVATLNEDPWLRFAAVHALGEIGDERAVDPLAELLGDEVARQEVVAALGKIGSPRALEHLARALAASDDAPAFEACLRAIGAALDRHPGDELPGVAGALLRADDAEAVRDRVVRVLTADEATPAADTAEAARDTLDARRAAAALVHALRVRELYSGLVLAGRDASLLETLEFHVLSLGAEILPTLRLGLSASDAGVRRLALQCLGALAGEEDAGTIAGHLGDHSAEVRLAAVVALTRLRGERHAHRMLPLLVDDDDDVRRATVTALARLDPGMVTLVLMTARPQSPAHLLPALEIMRTSSHPDQRPFIEGCLAHRAPEVRAAAVSALGAQRGDVISRLAAAVFDPEPMVRRAALGAIAQARTALARRILLQALEGNSEVQLDAVRALAALEDAAVVPALVRLLRARSPDLRRAAVTTLGGFPTATIIRHVAALATDPDAAVREEVARVLATSDDPVALSTLERLSLDASPATAGIARARLAS